MCGANSSDFHSKPTRDLGLELVATERKLVSGSVSGAWPKLLYLYDPGPLPTSSGGA